MESSFETCRLEISLRRVQWCRPGCLENSLLSARVWGSWPCWVSCSGFAWGLVVGGARSSQEQPGADQEQPRAAQSSQESSGTALGEPRVTQDTSKMTPWARSLGRQFSPQTLLPELRDPKIYKIFSLTRKKYQIDLWSSCVA